MKINTMKINMLIKRQQLNRVLLVTLASFCILINEICLVQAIHKQHNNINNNGKLSSVAELEYVSYFLLRNSNITDNTLMSLRYDDSADTTLAALKKQKSIETLAQSSTSRLSLMLESFISHLRNGRLRKLELGELIAIVESKISDKFAYESSMKSLNLLALANENSSSTSHQLTTNIDNNSNKQTLNSVPINNLREVQFRCKYLLQLHKLESAERQQQQQVIAEDTMQHQHCTGESCKLVVNNNDNNNNADFEYEKSASLLASNDGLLFELCKISLQCHSPDELIKLIKVSSSNVNNANFSHETENAHIERESITSVKSSLNSLLLEPTNENINQDDNNDDDDSISMSLTKLCPLMLFYMHDVDNQCNYLYRDDTPSQVAIWAFATLFVTIVCFCSLLGITIVALISSTPNEYIDDDDDDYDGDYNEYDDHDNNEENNVNERINNNNSSDSNDNSSAQSNSLKQSPLNDELTTRRLNNNNNNNKKNCSYANVDYFSNSLSSQSNQHQSSQSSNRNSNGRKFRKSCLTFFEGLAVGSLVGSALFSLVPEAFELHERESNERFLLKALIIFLGIYLFFISERIVRIIVDRRRYARKLSANSIPLESTTNYMNETNNNDHHHLNDNYQNNNIVNTNTNATINNNNNNSTNINNYYVSLNQKNLLNNRTTTNSENNNNNANNAGDSLARKRLLKRKRRLHLKDTNNTKAGVVVVNANVGSSSVENSHVVQSTNDKFTLQRSTITVNCQHEQQALRRRQRRRQQQQQLKQHFTQSIEGEGNEHRVQRIAASNNNKERKKKGNQVQSGSQVHVNAKRFVGVNPLLATSVALPSIVESNALITTQASVSTKLGLPLALSRKLVTQRKQQHQHQQQRHSKLSANSNSNQRNATSSDEAECNGNKLVTTSISSSAVSATISKCKLIETKTKSKAKSNNNSKTKSKTVALLALKSCDSKNRNSRTLTSSNYTNNNIKNNNQLFKKHQHETKIETTINSNKNRNKNNNITESHNSMQSYTVVESELSNLTPTSSPLSTSANEDDYDDEPSNYKTGVRVSSSSSVNSSLILCGSVTSAMDFGDEEHTHKNMTNSFFDSSSESATDIDEPFRRMVQLRSRLTNNNNNNNDHDYDNEQKNQTQTSKRANQMFISSMSHHHNHRRHHNNSSKLYNNEYQKFKRKEISSVAWMIMIGDGLHNFIDGISIGFAFSESILSGVSISVAVLCEEFPHELGDFAVLISSGLTIRQALGCNFLSACTCYLGMAVGIVLGDVTDSVCYISALAGGMFLYIALVNVMGELSAKLETTSRVSITKTLKLFLIQNLGIILGISIIFTLSYFDFEP